MTRSVRAVETASIVLGLTRASELRAEAAESIHELRRLPEADFVTNSSGDAEVI
jgi:hypothetical protein